MTNYDFLVTISDLIKKTLKSDLLISEAMKIVIDNCQENIPNDDWQKFIGLSYNDTVEIEKWLENVFTPNPLSDEIKALWFGMFNLNDDKDEMSADIYVSGTNEFDIDDEAAEWACDPIYFPDNRYAKSSILDNICHIAYDQNSNEPLENNAEYPLSLAYGCFIIKELMTTLPIPLILGESKNVYVAVGFDSGDFILIGNLDIHGFHLIEE